jgi:cell wall-associated NlpC family hydrolase
MKAYIIFIITAVTAASCSSVKPVASSAVKPAGRTEKKTVVKEKAVAAPASSAISKRKVKTLSTFRPVFSPYENLSYTGNVESSAWLQFKYSIVLDVPVEALNNPALLGYIDEWYGVPYRYGGSTKEGIDCSAFTAGLMAGVFGLTIPRTAREQYQNSLRIEKEDLREGDLVFFNTTGGISHVGIYLVNNRFAHASTSSGIMISDLNEDYFFRRYQGAGRFITRHE